MLVGEPGNGKTFFVEYLCAKYRDFLALPENRKYTFRFTGMDQLGSYGRIHTIESQTYEDPLILAMNLGETRNESMQLLSKTYGFSDDQIEEFYEDYRPMGRLQQLYPQRAARLYRRENRGSAQPYRDHPGAADRIARHRNR